MDQIESVIKFAEKVAYEEGYRDGRSETLGKYFEATIKNYELGYHSGIKSLAGKLEKMLLEEDLINPTDATIVISRLENISEELFAGDKFKE